MKRRCVAPLAGAWIEINIPIVTLSTSLVAPLAGAWIEIFANAAAFSLSVMSLPLRGRGLKSNPPFQTVHFP